MPLNIFRASAKIRVGGNLLLTNQPDICIFPTFVQKHKLFIEMCFLPPVVSCEHLQTHLSLSLSFVLKSLPGCPMLLILPAVPLKPLRCIL